MDKLITIASLLALVGTGITGTSVMAQSYFTPKSHIVFRVMGSSTVHNWSMTSHEATGDLTIWIEEGQIKHIHSLVVTIPAESLKSDQEALNNNAHKALKTKKYPSITYELTDFIVLAEEHPSLRTNGRLTLAGVTRATVLTVTSTVSRDQVLFKGQIPLKMSDFDIKPPTFLLGTLKADDEVTVSFEVAFQPARQ